MAKTRFCFTEFEKLQIGWNHFNLVSIGYPSSIVAFLKAHYGIRPLKCWRQGQAEHHLFWSLLRTQAWKTRKRLRTNRMNIYRKPNQFFPCCFLYFIKSCSRLNIRYEPLLRSSNFFRYPDSKSKNREKVWFFAKRNQWYFCYAFVTKIATQNIVAHSSDIGSWLTSSLTVFTWK